MNWQWENTAQAFKMALFKILMDILAIYSILQVMSPIKLKHQETKYVCKNLYLIGVSDLI